MVSAGRPQGTVMENVANGLHLTTISVGCGKIHPAACAFSLVMFYQPDPRVSWGRPFGSQLSILFSASFSRRLGPYHFFFLVGYVEERLWWPIKSPNIGGKKKRAA